MLHLNLMQQEQQILIDVLESTLSDLRAEIAGTDNMDFREGLKGRKQVINKVLETLRQSEQGAQNI